MFFLRVVSDLGNLLEVLFNVFIVTEVMPSSFHSLLHALASLFDSTAFEDICKCDFTVTFKSAKLLAPLSSYFFIDFMEAALALK